MKISMSSKLCLVALAASVSLSMVGCGGGYESATEKYSPAMDFSEESEALALSESAGSDEAVPLETLAGKTSVDNRKIIYTSTIDLVVDDYIRFESQLPALVSKHGGFIANSDTDRRYQNQQSGNWVVRIPVQEYDAFLSGVTAFGFAESRSENAQDVTEEYVDVEARIRNKQTLEKRLVTMLEERTGNLSDVLEIERELSRVREEIERMQGRLRFLQDRTSLATITIRCREQKEYQPAEAPTLASRIVQSWNDSTGSLRIAGENVLIALIALTPWLIVVAIPLLLLWKLFKRRRAKYKSV